MTFGDYIAHALVAQFAQERDAHGRLAHPHFEAVKMTMADIIERDGGTLEQAYKLAVKTRLN